MLQFNNLQLSKPILQLITPNLLTAYETRTYNYPATVIFSQVFNLQQSTINLQQSTRRLEMGEFLLSILGFDPTNKHLIYTRNVYRAKWKVGEVVAIANPNPKRETIHKYYRVYNKFYPVEVLHELVRSQDPIVIDKTILTAKHRRHIDEQIVKELNRGRSADELGREYGWHPEAIKLALVRENGRKNSEQADEFDYDDDEPIQFPEHLSAEEVAKREALLAQWE